MSAPISEVRLRPAFTGRGDETVEAVVSVGPHRGRATAPAGASAGRHEAVHLPPGGAAEALRNFDASRLLGVDASDPRAVTGALRSMDATPNYSRIGGATAYAVSVAALEAASAHLGKPMYELIGLYTEPRLPLPLGNVLGGGKHAGGGAPDVQEFLVFPLDPATPLDAIRVNLRVHALVRKGIERRDPTFPAGKGDEGAWAPRMNTLEALDVVSQAAAEASDELGVRVALGMDVAASSLWSPSDRAYVYSREGRRLSPEEQISFMEELADKYGLRYLEDPLHEDDFEGFSEITRWARGRGVLVVGDDLLVTSASRLERAAGMGAAAGAILKVNQAGSLGEAMEFARACRSRGYSIIASHRSGDTWDSHLAHVAVGTGAIMMKSGVVGGERMAKHMEILRIAESHPGMRMAGLG
ncbi:MAG: phosphopyruvate hydratase [Conexivisphaera sp.]